MIAIELPCVFCPTKTTIRVHEKDWVEWTSGKGKQKMVQDQFPYLTPAEREGLITRTCEKCFDSIVDETVGRVNLVNEIDSIPTGDEDVPDSHR